MVDDIRLDPTAQLLLHSANEFELRGGILVPPGTGNAPGFDELAPAREPQTMTVEEELAALRQREADRDALRAEIGVTWLDSHASETATAVAEQEGAGRRLLTRLGAVASGMITPMLTAEDHAKRHRAKPEVIAVKPKAIKYVALETAPTERTITPQTIVASAKAVINQIRQSRMDRKPLDSETVPVAVNVRANLAGKNRLQRGVEASLLAASILTAALVDNGPTPHSDKTHQEVESVSPSMLVKSLEQFNGVEELAPGNALPESIKKLIPDVQAIINDPMFGERIKELGQHKVVNTRIISSLIWGLSSGNVKAEGLNGRIGLMQIPQAVGERYLPGVYKGDVKELSILVGSFDFNLRLTAAIKTGKYASTDKKQLIRAAIMGEGAGLIGEGFKEGVGIEPDPALASGLADKVLAFYDSWPNNNEVKK